MTSLLKNVIFTIRDYNESDYEKIKHLDYKYLILTRSTEKEDSTRTIRGYIEFSTYVTTDILTSINARIEYQEREVPRNAIIASYKNDNNYEELKVKRHSRMISLKDFDYYK